MSIYNSIRSAYLLQFCLPYNEKDILSNSMTFSRISLLRAARKILIIFRYAHFPVEFYIHSAVSKRANENNNSD